jgi:hypothetical protein
MMPLREVRADPPCPSLVQNLKLVFSPTGGGITSVRIAFRAVE